LPLTVSSKEGKTLGFSSINHHPQINLKAHGGGKANFLVLSVGSQEVQGCDVKTEFPALGELSETCSCNDELSCFLF